jgi:hypothetical protein
MRGGRQHTKGGRQGRLASVVVAVDRDAARVRVPSLLGLRGHAFEVSGSGSLSCATSQTQVGGERRVVWGRGMGRRKGESPTNLEPHARTAPSQQ